MEDKPKTIACVIMAAGAGTRFGGDKLLYPVEGVTLIERALACVPEGVFTRVVIVTGDDIIAEAARRRGFSVVYNRAPQRGASHTVMLGTQSNQEADGIMFMAADQPYLTQNTVRRIAELWLSDTSRIVVPAADGVWGNPCIFPKELYPELCMIEGDRGGKTVIKQHEDMIVFIETPARELIDVDTKADIQNA